MDDTIRGPVTNIVDGDTFDMKVIHTSKGNHTQYNNEQRIRMADINEPELTTPAGKRPKEKLESKLKGKEVRCHVQTRDSNGESWQK